jgi:hypothetical protein
MDTKMSPGVAITEIEGLLIDAIAFCRTQVRDEPYPLTDIVWQSFDRLLVALESAQKLTGQTITQLEAIEHDSKLPTHSVGGRESQ